MQNEKCKMQRVFLIVPFNDLIFFVILDKFLKSRKRLMVVIPAKAGIQLS